MGNCFGSSSDNDVDPVSRISIYFLLEIKLTYKKSCEIAILFNHLQEERRRQMAAAAEKRVQQEESRGMKDPEGMICKKLSISVCFTY